MSDDDALSSAEEPAMTAPTRPRVVLFGLGGTIAMTGAGGRAAVPTLTAGQLLARTPAGDDITVTAVDVRHVPGASVRFADVYGVAAACAGEFARGAVGAVVTQGTDTIEETAYLLDLLHSGPQPVVVTGAMRNPSLPGADGPANLSAAVRTAAAPALAGLGALVVFADEIHAAARVRKTHATSIATFVSPNGGPVGYLVDGEPCLVNPVPRRALLPVHDGLPQPPAEREPRVALLTVTLDDRGELLAGADGLDGLVVAAMGAGHVPEPLVPALERLAERMPVVLASRTGAGPVLKQMYGFPGSERDLIRRGLIRAGFLHPLKARVLLHALLAAGADRATIAAAVQAAGA
jgi:L-asparaginase